MAKNVAKQKPSDWLSEIGSHTIVASAEAKRDFEEKTGIKAPSWPETSAAKTRKDIAGRGLGGSLRASSEQQKMAYGWLMAEAAAGSLVPDNDRPWLMYEGRGRRFWSAIEVLQKAGL